jgi:Meiotically up-regulated gene 113
MDREFILSEIRRAAELNGGGPLSRRRFERLSGISEGVWYGKYWLTWTDAAREAGVQAGLLNGAFDEQALLARLALLTRKLGRFPTQAEKKMERASDASFPNAKAFERFGGRAEQMAALIRFATGSEAFGNIVQLMPASAASVTDELLGEVATTGPSEGFVYLIRLGRAFKIGRTFAVPRRPREITLELPQKPDVVHVIRTDDPNGIEAYWHRRFESKRTNGEWFALDSADVKAFKRRKFM